MKANSVVYCTVLLSAMVEPQYVPKDGFVPDATTAVKIAEAVLIPVYGEKRIESERPFNAVLENDTWTVDGTVHCPDDTGGQVSFCFGGAAEVKLSKIHYK